MAFNINNFRSNGMIYGGARPTQFQVDLFPPFSSANKNRIRMFIQAATLPAFTIGQAPAPYFGAVIKYSGDRQYADWNVDVMNDEDFPVRSMLEKWSNMMNALVSNRLDPAVYPTGYKAPATVTQFGKDGRLLRSYTFQGLFPINIGDIQLNWGQTNQIETFPVTFSLDYYEPSDQTSASDTYNSILADDTSGNLSGQQGAANVPQFPGTTTPG